MVDDRVKSIARWWQLPEIFPLAVFALGFTTVNATRPIASYKALELGASPLELGIVGGSFAFLATIASIPIGARIDTSGERPFILLGLILLILAPLIEFYSSSISVLILGQILLGLGQISLGLAMQALTGNTQSVLTTDEKFARLSMAAALGQTMGPVLAGYTIEVYSLGGDRSEGLSMAFLLAVSVSMVAVIIAIPLVKSSKVHKVGTGKDRNFDIKNFLKRKGVPPALMSSVATLITIDLLVIYLPLLGEEYGLAASAVGVLLALRSGAGLLSRFTLPLLLRWMDRTSVLRSALLIAGLSAVGVAVFPFEITLTIFVVTLGYGLGVGSPMTIAWLSSLANEGERGSVLAIRMAMSRFGQLLIPMALGGLALSSGAASVFFVSAASLCGLSFWVNRTEKEID